MGRDDKQRRLQDRSLEQKILDDIRVEKEMQILRQSFNAWFKVGGTKCGTTLAKEFFTGEKLL